MLFAETMAIRWLGIEIPVLRAFPNLILMLVFIGASAGIAQPEKRVGKVKVIASLLCLIGSVIIVPVTGLKDISLRLDETNSPMAVVAGLTLILLNAFSLLTLFREIGCAVGEEFKNRPPLKSYSVNILGSMAGVLVFAICSFLNTAPWIWLLVAIASAFAYSNNRKLAFMLPLVVASFFSSQGAFWSPYGKLEIKPFEVPANSIFGQGNYMLFCNNVYFHSATHVPEKTVFDERDKGVDVSKEREDKEHLLLHAYKWMKLPYRFAPAHKDVLILGSGSGNDVSFGEHLPQGPESIDAVEIDPVIGTFGQTIHPDKPYLEKRANLIINDARSHLHDSPKRYDIVNFAYLDPGGTLNTASFMRVDNFVFTKESVQDALKLLKDDGIVSMSFATGADHPVTARLYNTIRDAWGKEPLTLVDDSFSSCIFLFGPGMEKNMDNVAALVRQSLADDHELKVWRPSDAQRQMRIASDDWPFLYLQFDTTGMLLYSSFLLFTILIPVPFLFRVDKTSVLAPQSFAMFVLGEAFMLMETKCCTELSLIYGNTWVVSSVVIFSFLTLGYLANLLVLKQQSIKLPFVYIALTIILVADYFLSFHGLNLPSAQSKILMTVMTCLPVFFGGILFSSHFKSIKDPNMGLAANLLGVTFGGLLENLCVVGGIKSLSLLTLFLYLLSALPFLIKPKAGQAATTGAQADGDSAAEDSAKTGL
ncbi:MAG: hypothetical protein QG625_2644 [Cyanobacteriota bacterium erpe_2018_sw_39hr_WHONDRS-SW48-000098_B_bin.30]|nr:hypothetical protein [Cyanobacteriota bacterium erpe_2018_sw_39hr_WHONDRS-SW48-000098_B_bin.30]